VAPENCTVACITLRLGRDYQMGHMLGKSHDNHINVGMARACFKTILENFHVFNCFLLFFIVLKQFFAIPI
jgi:hypothetical protein